MKLIDLHKEWCKKGMMHDYGICNSVPQEYWRYLKIVQPTPEELNDHKEEGYGGLYWGGIKKQYNDEYFKGYNPFRQSIVLLICAMSNEL